jgi:hypothetical protein
MYILFLSWGKIVEKERGNFMPLTFTRVMEAASALKAEVELLLETCNREHVREIIKLLRDRGYGVEAM